jgi:hypothetical protein
MLFYWNNLYTEECIWGRFLQTPLSSETSIFPHARAISDKFIPQIGGSNSSGTSFYEIIAPVF